jgi:hypothetical protein
MYQNLDIWGHTSYVIQELPYLWVYKPHFLDKNLPSKIGGYVILTTEPVTPVLYAVKLPAETASVWDCYLAS